MVKQNIGGGWRAWRGDDVFTPCHSDDVVEVLCAYGAIHKGPSSHFVWRHLGQDGDIVAYRIVEPFEIDDAEKHNKGRIDLSFLMPKTKEPPTAPPPPPPRDVTGGDHKDTNPKDMIGVRKVGLSTLPWRVLYRLGLGMLEGASKYGRHNYRVAGVRASVYFDATVARHIGPWWEGEDIDPDSGEHHIDKAITSLMVMRDSMLQGNFVDDRPPRGNLNLPELNERAGEIIDRNADKNPRHYTIADTPEEA